MNTEQKKLDKTRPFGMVMGDPKRFFEQDGVHFDAEGRAMETWATPEALQNERHIQYKIAEKQAILAKQRALRERRRQAKEDE